MDALVVALATLLAMLACALAGTTWLVRRERRVRGRAALSDWAGGLALQAIGWVLLGLDAAALPWTQGVSTWLVAGAAGLLVAGYASMLRALLVAIDAPAPGWQAYLGALAVVGLLVVPGLSPGQRPALAWLAALLTLSPFLRVLLRLLWQSAAWPQRCIAVAFLAAGAVSAWSCVAAWRAMAASLDPGALAPAQAATLVVLLVVPVFATFAFLMLQQERRRTWLEGLSARDSLAGTHDRRAFFEQAERLVQQQRTGNRLVAWLMIDIDAFEAINERHGRPVADVLLGKVADELRDTLRGHDIAGHFGGDEYCALLFDVDAGEASERAERLRQRIAARPIGADGALVFTTISIGVAHARADRDLDFEALMRLADKRLYLAKRTGRNRVVAADVALDVGAAAAAPGAARPGSAPGR